jgi:hypothetical protein
MRAVALMEFPSTNALTIWISFSIGRTFISACLSAGSKPIIAIQGRQRGLPRLLISPAGSANSQRGFVLTGLNIQQALAVCQGLVSPLNGGERQWYKHTSGVLFIGCLEIDGHRISSSVTVFVFPSFLTANKKPETGALIHQMMNERRACSGFSEPYKLNRDAQNSPETTSPNSSPYAAFPPYDSCGGEKSCESNQNHVSQSPHRPSGLTQQQRDSLARLNTRSSAWCFAIPFISNDTTT